MTKRIYLTDDQHTDLITLADEIRYMREWRDSGKDFDEDVFNEDEATLSEQLVDLVLGLHLAPKPHDEPISDDRGGWW